MDVLLELPVPLLHIMRDIRIEQLEEQKKQMDQSMNTPAVAGAVPSLNGLGQGLEELTDELS